MGGHEGTPRRRLRHHRRRVQEPLEFIGATIAFSEATAHNLRLQAQPTKTSQTL